MVDLINVLAGQAIDVALANSLEAGGAIQAVVDVNVEEGRLPVHRESAYSSLLASQLSGFGFLQPFLDDEEIEEFWINEPGTLRFARNGQHEAIALGFDAQELQSIVERLIRSSGRRLDRSTPFIDAQLENGYRFHAVVPDITRKNLSLNIRKFRKHVISLSEMLQGQVLSHSQSEFLVARMNAGANVIISGATQSGKTTLLGALLNSLDRSERVVSVEDTFELRCQLPDWVAMQTRPPSLEGKFEIDLRRLVRESLRMRPTRLVVGEVRGAEALDLLIAMNSGIPGMCTIHANSATEALSKLRTLPLLAGNNITIDFLDSIIGTSLDLFVHCERDSHGRRRLAEIMEVDPTSGLQLRKVAL